MSGSIQDVDGIDLEYAELLTREGIDTPEKLLEIGGNREGRRKLAERISMNESRILKWVCMCDLYRIKGVFN